MKKILVPFDFSKPAINAFRFALDVACQSGGIVHLVNVIELPAMPNSAFTPVRGFEMPFKRETSAKVQASFEKITRQYRQEGVDVISKVEFGTPSKTLLDYAKKNSIELIVMGSRGHTGLKEVLIGSNTEKMVRTSPVPVIVVKDFYKGPLKNIVFPFTANIENQKTLVAKIKDLQAFFKAKLHIVFVNTPANFTLDTLTTKRMIAFARQYKLKDFTLNVFNHLYEEEGIIHFAESVNADMITMGTHGRKGLSHFMYGSKTENVVSRSKTLLWTFVMDKK